MRTLAALILIVALSSCVSVTPASKLAPLPNPTYALVVFDVVDSVTGQPVTANITIRREWADGTLIDEQPTYTGTHIEIQATVEPDVYIWVLAEAEGYQDWEVRLRVTKFGNLKGPIRLTPENRPSSTPGVQG